MIVKLVCNPVFSNSLKLKGNSSMKKSEYTFLSSRLVRQCMAAISLLALLISSAASADEADAKRLLKEMSDYLAGQTYISFNYDSTLEVVTPDDQVLGLASSGTLSMARPGSIRATRSGGFADVEMNFDGTTFTIFGKNMNAYTQVEIPGDIDNVVNKLREDYGRPLPAADLLTTDAYDALMADVTDIKDLGSGVVGGVECDSLAFRKPEVDFQIWIAQGDARYPCKYVITSKKVANGPKYSIEISHWETGAAVKKIDYTFKNSTNADKVDLKDLKDTGDLPDNFVMITGESE